MEPMDSQQGKMRQLVVFLQSQSILLFQANKTNKSPYYKGFHLKYYSNA